MDTKAKAKYVKTDVWNSIIKMLVENQWEVVEKYDNFDAGIDYDFVVLEKDNEKIEFFWDNWMEGEIHCNVSRMEAIEKSMGLTLISNPARRPIQE